MPHEPGIGAAGFWPGSRAAAGTAWPLLLILDDLQWADDLTLGFLKYQARVASAAEAPGAVLIVGTYRTEEVDPQKDGPLQQVLAQPEVTRVRLDRLDEAAVGSIGRIRRICSPTFSDPLKSFPTGMKPKSWWRATAAKPADAMHPQLLQSGVPPN